MNTQEIEELEFAVRLFTRNCLIAYERGYDPSAWQKAISLLIRY